jgi:hypothetical protein
MTTTATKTYYVGVIERAIAYYEVEAEDARTAAENWEEGEFKDRDDEAHESEGPCSVRERQPDGSWRKVPLSEWEAAPPAVNNPAEIRYVIHSADEDGYWSNEFGWGGIEAAHVFTAAEQSDLQLPLGGRWVALKPFSVLLHYPDDLDNTGYETYYAFVEAADPIEAVAAAQRQAVAVQSIKIDDPTDFHPLLVTEGHHASQPLFNR